jgi:dTDP-4-dehydrorhamnose reductase
MKIFISGASGLIGGNCLSYFKEKNETVIGSYFSYKTDDTVFFDTLNLDDKNNFDISTFSPDVIVHCGALTHVDYCETNEEESYQKSVQSTINLLAIAKKLNAKLVYISTDYVFDGKQGPYNENASTNPLSIYAKHKLEAEELVKKDNANHLVLRVTNVYGNEIRNKNFVARIIEQCQAKQHLTLKLPIDQYATPVDALDVAKCMYLLLQDNKNCIYNIASNEFVNRVELANNVLQYFPEATFDMIPVTTEELNQPAKRPLLGGLKNDKFLKEYLSFEFNTVANFVKNKIR